MKKFIGCDPHAHYPIFASLREDGQWDPPVRPESLSILGNFEALGGFVVVLMGGPERDCGDSG